MMARMVKTLGALPARQLHLIGAGLLLVLAAGLWTYGLRAPLASLAVSLFVVPHQTVKRAAPTRASWPRNWRSSMPTSWLSRRAWDSARSTRRRQKCWSR